MVSILRGAAVDGLVVAIISACSWVIKAAGKAHLPSV